MKVTHGYFLEGDIIRYKDKNSFDRAVTKEDEERWKRENATIEWSIGVEWSQIKKVIRKNSTKGEKRMKVKSGKLQVGDVKHWKDGEKQVICGNEESDLYPNKIFGDGAIEWLLEEPTDIKKITRKQPKEIELGPIEIIQKGDIVRYDNESPILVVDSSGFVGKRVSSVVGYPNMSKVYRPIKKSKNPWKETGRMLDEMIEAELIVKIRYDKEDMSTPYRCAVKNVNFESPKISLGTTVHSAVSGGYKWAKDCEWL